MEQAKKDRTKKIVNIVLNVVVAIICVFILFFAIMALTKTDAGYNKLFGHTILNVVSPSMDGDQEDSFKKDDIIIGKLITLEEAKNLKEGDIITFWTVIDGKNQLNTHRIVDIEFPNTEDKRYITKGDAIIANDAQAVLPGDIVSIYTGKIKGGAKFLNFMQSQTGFLIFVVIPSVLAAGYCIFLFVMNLRGYGKVKKEEDEVKMREQIELQTAANLKAQLLNDDTLKAQLQAQLLEELRASGQIPGGVVAPQAEETVEKTEEKEETASAEEAASEDNKDEN